MLNFEKMKTSSQIPNWMGGGEWAGKSFVINKLERNEPLKSAELPLTEISLCGFLFLMEGEVVADIDGETVLCRGGQFLLVPADVPFMVHHYRNVVGYTGAFSMQFLRDVSYPCLSSNRAVLHTFWFDEASFMAGMMERMVTSFARGDEGALSRFLDLILYRIQSPMDIPAHPMVMRFMKLLFDRDIRLITVSGYAERLNISPSYLNKLVRSQTRHSAMEWIEIARVNWAKNLLGDRSIPVSEVSLAVGIDDPSYFTRFFRKYTGMTPSAFRKQIGG